MKRVLGFLAVLIGLAILLVVGMWLAARFHDGPLALFSGGSFSSGERYQGPEPDWSFLKDHETVEFQLLVPARSRTTWIVEHDNRIFIPSGYMNSTVGRLWKQWPRQAEADGRAILRVDGRLYERQLVRIRSGDILTPVLAELGRKYAGGQPVPLSAVTSDDLWIFELLPR